MEKIILDTDIGSDVDDAVCLAWLLRERNCRLLGITTVTGDTRARAALATVLCCEAGRDDIPVYAGLQRPFLLEHSRQPTVPQSAILGRWSHTPPESFSESGAIPFLRKTIREHPGEVTLLAIGPLTNIAALFTADPKIPQLLKGLVIMGGNFTPVRWHAPSGAGTVESNIWQDPHAAQIVYRSAVRIHRSVGIDVTTQVQMSPSAVRERFRCEGLDAVLDMASVWFSGGREEITFHDPLAAVSIFEPDILRYGSGSVSIVTEGLMEGFTLFDRSTPVGSIPHEVATEVCAESFFERYFGNFR